MAASGRQMIWIGPGYLANRAVRDSPFRRKRISSDPGNGTVDRPETEQ
jgi:hypothetical protein